MVFDLINMALPFSQDFNLDVLRFVAAFFTASVLAWLVAWAGSTIGAGACICMAVSLFLSPWLLVFGRNLYWVFGMFYLPMVYLAWKGEKLGQANAAETRRVLGVYFLLFFAKCACGYEYVSTMVFGAFALLCFFAYRDKWDLKRLFRLGLGVGLLPSWPSPWPF